MSKKMPTLDQKFYQKVKDIAKSLYLDNNIQHDKAEYFIAKCYTEAVITCLNAEGLIEVKETDKQTGVSE